MKLIINDTAIQGTVSFEQFEDRARMSYIMKPGAPGVPLGRVYGVGENQWRVVGFDRSKFNPTVMNVFLELVRVDN